MRLIHSALSAVPINGSAPPYRGLVMHVADLYVDELLAAPANAGAAAGAQVCNPMCQIIDQIGR